MPVFAPSTLAQWTSGRWTSEPSGPLTGFSTDSRRLSAGQVFVALRTDKRDGHDFLAAAKAAGAAAALVDRADGPAGLPLLVVADPLAALQSIAREHRRTFRGPVVGVTGSAGKTSTKNLLALLLGGAEAGVLATEGNLNNHIGVPLTLTALDPAKHRVAVVEAGISVPDEMALLASMIEPDIAIVTLVAPAHLEGLGSVEGVAAEKAALPAAVRPGGLAIFPVSCAGFSAFRALRVPVQVIDPAGVSGDDRVACGIDHRGNETRLTVALPGARPATLHLARVSDGMAQNAALAVAAAVRLGVDLHDMQRRLAGWKPAPLRGEIIRDGGRLIYIDCYNANPASMADALAAFRGLEEASRPRLYVLGCMEELGGSAPLHHYALGRMLDLREEDRVVAVGDQADDVRAGAIAIGAEERQIEVVTGLDRPRELLRQWQGAVFIKGSRRYQLETLLQAEGAHAAH